MLYESAWQYRVLGEVQVNQARAKLQQESLKKQQQQAAKDNPQSLPAAITGPPDIPPAKVPLQPDEQKAHAQYEAIIAGFSDLALAIDARFELAELLAARDDFDRAIKLLVASFDKEPAPELSDKIRIQLGICYAAKGNMTKALDQFNLVAQNPKSAMSAHGHYRAGECYMQLKDWARAATRFTEFRDKPPFQNLPGLTDRALLRLGQALAQQGKWDQSRQALEILAGRFASSPWIHEARYGIGWALQNLKQYDQAVNVYQQVTNATATETAAKAQLQIGLCRIDQKRFAEAATALMVVPYTYAYPEFNAAALCEAGRTLLELKQPTQAVKLLERVINDYPKSPWAQIARERLAAMK
jgi:tetratricopeptide (TPR) repeat protein